MMRVLRLDVPVPFSAYGTLHRLVGWVFVPSSVVVFTGFLNRRQRR
jgi:hypothetical protein